MARERRAAVLVAAISAIALAAACEDKDVDPGPFDIDGWIGKCETRCGQIADCEPEELLFYYGDLDNCVAQCTYSLDKPHAIAFVDETDDACLEALYSQLGCVYGLGCASYDEWEDGGDDAPCAEAEAAATEACAAVDPADLDDFLGDCAWPPEPPA